MSPHSVPRIRYHNNNSNNSGSPLFGTSKQVLLVLATAIPSFLLGSTVSLYVRLDNATVTAATAAATATTSNAGSVSQAMMEANIQKAIQETKRACQVECNQQNQQLQQQQAKLTSQQSIVTTDKVFPKDMVGNFVSSAALVPKDNLTATMDLGVPLDNVYKKGSTHALVLYMQTPSSSSSSQAAQEGKVYTVDNAATAFESCDTVNMVFTDHSGKRKQCLAIVPQYEAFHLQHWKRRSSSDGGGGDGNTNNNPLEIVGRGLKDNGRDEFGPPSKVNADKAMDFWTKYFTNLPAVLSELTPLLQQIATTDNTVIVMVCNFGQSELLLNFLCQARARNFDTSMIIVFCTDAETFAIVQAMGITAYFDQRNFGDLPLDAARRYGDRFFTAMMLAKVVCVQLVSQLGYNFLFQDVDLVWFRHPLDYFRQLDAAETWDVYFQDDGGHSLRYAPYSANTGFYFSRHNDRTKRFFTSVLLNADMIIQTYSHQQALIAVLNEHASLHGLKVKVYGRDTDDFPGGFQWNQPSKAYMRRYFKGEVDPWIFHMSWTLNKKNKILYLEQFAEWWVQPQCVENKEVGSWTDVPTKCCLVEPKFECHYRDKPSKFPCKDSPPIDKGRPSFWP